MWDRAVARAWIMDWQPGRDLGGRSKRGGTSGIDVRRGVDEAVGMAVGSRSRLTGPDRSSTSTSRVVWNGPRLKTRYLCESTSNKTSLERLLRERLEARRARCCTTLSNQITASRPRPIDSREPFEILLLASTSLQVRKPRPKTPWQDL